jgi:hypothetical protein
VYWASDPLTKGDRSLFVLLLTLLAWTFARVASASRLPDDRRPVRVTLRNNSFRDSVVQASNLGGLLVAAS